MAPAPCACGTKHLGVDLLVTALAHLHLRNLARINYHAANNNIFPMAVPD
jgi:hypothetical protein